MAAATITLSGTAAHNLYAVLAGNDVTGVSCSPTFALADLAAVVRNLGLQADKANGGSIYVGNSSVASTAKGAEMLATDYKPFGPTQFPSIDITKIYIRASAATQLLNVDVQP